MTMALRWTVGGAAALGVAAAYWVAGGPVTAATDAEGRFLLPDPLAE